MNLIKRGPAPLGEFDPNSDMGMSVSEWSGIASTATKVYNSGTAGNTTTVGATGSSSATSYLVITNADLASGGSMTVHRRTPVRRAPRQVSTPTAPQAPCRDDPRALAVDRGRRSPPLDRLPRPDPLEC